MHFVTAKSILSAKNGMNLYRGCLHGCIYCDSRSNCYNMQHKFEDIEIKSNAIELLEQALKKKRKKCIIGMGSMTDPYIPLETKIQNTRKALEVIYKYGFGATLITKSAFVLNDLDILKEINKKTKCIIQMTLTTFDEKLCKIIEPNVSSTKERFETLKILNKNNIPTVVWLTPILPFINDTKENVTGILDYCIKAKVYGIICFGMGVTLRNGNREFFYEKLDKFFPGLKEEYIKIYKNNYILNSPNNKYLMNVFYKTCKQYNIICNNDKIFEYLNTFEDKDTKKQLELF